MCYCEFIYVFTVSDFVIDCDLNNIGQNLIFFYCFNQILEDYEDKSHEDGERFQIFVIQSITCDEDKEFMRARLHASMPKHMKNAHVSVYVGELIQLITINIHVSGRHAHMFFGRRAHVYLTYTFVFDCTSIDIAFCV